MMGGILFSAVGAGVLSLGVSLLSGHPLLVSLGLYSLAGCCGILAYALQTLTPDRA
ncbi:hypothetical protein [Xinfangfangia pollutisoli]|uniref:hypothetical protein n=1 Tax=Xinfangfangia pollutisoli TaxID=2865960 RepID=UPI001CD2E208|nr:hypothetical protein [Xinfangfangia pollutisoli]